MPRVKEWAIIVLVLVPMLAAMAADAAAQTAGGAAGVTLPTGRGTPTDRTRSTPAGSDATDPRGMTPIEKKREFDDAAAGAGILGFGLVGFLCVILAVLAFEMLPWMIAVLRGHNETVPIFLLCFFLGWTGLGWIIALIWSFSSNTRSDDRRRFGRRGDD